MLSAEQILGWLDNSDPSKLGVVPSPAAEQVRDRSATSLDLRLGRWFRSFKQTHTPSFDLTPGSGETLKTKQHFIQFGQPFVIHPGSFVLGATLEWLSLPAGLSAYVSGKSTLGRHGLIIETAAGIHPGFSGCLTLELGNVGEIPLEIHPGMKICQVFFHEVKAAAEQQPGIASGSRKPVLPRQANDDIFMKLSKKDDGTEAS
jgi:dCTP deaminase